MTVQPNSITEEGLKIKFLTQRMSEIVSDYEDKVANLQVTVAYLNQELQRYQQAEAQKKEAEAPFEVGDVREVPPEEDPFAHLEDD